MTSRTTAAPSHGPEPPTVLCRKDLEPEDLFEVVSQALLSAVDRDAMSGWGAVVHVVTADRIETRRLQARMD